MEFVKLVMWVTFVTDITLAVLTDIVMCCYVFSQKCTESYSQERNNGAI